VNLLTVIIDFLALNGKVPENVRWIGSYNGMYAIKWNEFAEIAKQLDSNDIVAIDFILVGDNWWAEYDASGWSMNKLPKMSLTPKPFDKISPKQIGEEKCMTLQEIMEYKPVEKVEAKSESIKEKVIEQVRESKKKKFF
jgi:hypothetical protein